MGRWLSIVGFTGVLFLCLVLAAAHAAAPGAVPLAKNGEALQQVVVSGAATEATRAVAEELAGYLARMTNASFKVRVGDGRSGIAVGRPADFPRLDLRWPGDSPAVEGRENYLLRSHANGLYVLGATEQAVSHAVWDLLYRLGHRQYFPGSKWEIVPKRPDLALAVDASEHPAYQVRMIWHGYGTWDFAKPAFADWRRKNRVASGIRLKFGHAYRGIYERNRAEFDRHPEYLCGGSARSGPVKFRISNPGLRRLVVADALRQLEQRPEVENVSLEPSDGGGWCDEELPELAGVSDRVLFLANEVAAAINEKYPGRLVTMNAYNFHAAPPRLQGHPQVLVTVATAFLKKSGATPDELLRGWGTRVSRLGIREYYSVNPWDHDMPAKARIARIDYLKRTIPEFHARGARVLSAESSDNWGPHGLGYYLAARLLWDVREAGNTDALVEDFLTNAFGAAKEPMREFYRQLDGAGNGPALAGRLGRMFAALRQARRLADAPAIQARLDDLVLYARYVDLYQQYARARGQKRQAAVEALLRHAWRMRGTMMVHTKALPRVIGKHDRKVTLPPGLWAGQGEGAWQSEQPFGQAELAVFVEEGLARYPVAGSGARLLQDESGRRRGGTAGVPAPMPAQGDAA